MPYLKFGWASTPSLPLPPRDSDSNGPPPYEHAAAASSGFIAHTETTTTTQTVTRTTTTFIPFHVWNNPNIDKELPETPDSSRTSSPASFSGAPQLRARSSIVALAQAGLGLGLQPQVTATATNSRNAVLAADGNGQNAPRQHHRAAERVVSSPAHVLRKSKSFSRDTHPLEPERRQDQRVPATPKASPQKAFVEKRARRLSFGASLLSSLHIGGAGTSSQEPVPPLPPTPPAISRKSSFWTRKRATTIEVAIDTGLPPTPSLPSVHPFTPLTLDNESSSPLSSELSNLSQPATNSHITPNNVPTPPASDTALRRRSTYSSGGPPSRRHSPSLSLNDARRSNNSSPRVSFLAPPIPSPRLTDSPVSEHHPPLPPSTPAPATAPVAPATRQRAMTNPTLLRRISFFASNPPPPDEPPVEPEPAPKPPAPKPPQPQGESPEIYVQRLVEAVSKAEVANVLAASTDEFHVRALQAYMDRFAFIGDPLDVALRKLLMHMALPRETQQIDRVMEAFAARYSRCNPGLFATDDLPYVLAFSLMMLHTDAFNKSNKRKMTKADYVKNTRLPGVPSELLEYYFDNITFAPFIFIEDPMDVNGSRLLSMTSMGGTTASASTLSTPSSSILRSNKVDPYYLITQDLLGPLRVEVRSLIAENDPYSVYGGDAHVPGAWDVSELQRAFARAPLVELEDKDTVDRRKSVMIGGFPPALTVPGVAPAAMSSSASYSGEFTMDGPWPGEIVTLRVTKVGVLWRKDEYADGGRKASSRKWKEWSVVLTGSQLLFFRDPLVAGGLTRNERRDDDEWRDDQSSSSSQAAHFLVPRIDILRPDEIISVEDAVAARDATYDKYPHVFRFSLPKGRQLLLRASDAAEMCAWLALINYASAFKTAGVRMRPLGLTWKEIEGAGMAAARSYLRDLQAARHQREQAVASPPRPPRSSTAMESKSDLHDGRRSSRPSLALSTSYRTSATLPLSARPQTPRARPRASWSGGTEGLDVMDAMSPDLDLSDQYRATFDEVKAALVAGAASSGRSRARRPSTAPAPDDRDRFALPTPSSSRAEHISSKIRDLDTRISAAAPALETELRFARNLTVLTPFRQTTRDRLVVVVNQLARRVAYLRMDLAKMRVHRETLSQDLAEERRQWARTKTQALQIATTALQNSRASVLPRVSLPDGSAPESPITPRSPRSPGLRLALTRRTSGELDTKRLTPSTPKASFLSPATPSGSVDSHMSSTAASDVEADRDREHEDSLGPLTSPSTSASFVLNSSIASTSSLATSAAERSTSSVISTGSGHEKFFTATESPEEAEEWDRTRAAKRVSLVRLPADTLAVIFSHHTRHISDGTPENEPSQARTPREEKRPLSHHGQ